MINRPNIVFENAPAPRRLLSGFRIPASGCWLLPFSFLLLPALAQTPGTREAMATLARGDFVSAEHQLRAEVAAHPNDAESLSLLGAALDNLKRVSEADEFHRRAVANAPRSTEVLNNYAAHLWIKGDEHEAAKIYRRVIAIDPSHYNANLQLARLALKDRKGAEALRYLDHLAPDQQSNPVVLLARLEALYRSGDRARGDELTVRLSEVARTDSKLAFAAGVELSEVEQYDAAEKLFEIALESSPADFNVLYDLGIAATHAGHYDRARDVLEAALRQQPKNIDVLYALACAVDAMKQVEQAAQLLAQAAKLDEHRADVQKMLAMTTGDLGALEDSAAAWDRYLKLVPGDDIARRERAYTAAEMGHFDKAIPELERFVQKHPADAAGHYELGQAQRSQDMSKSLEQFNKALAIDPNYLPARTARGSLYYQEGKPEAAVKDLEIAISLRPGDAANLDRLGQTYQALDRTADAVRVLRRAAELAPSDSKILLHFARALADGGNTDESKSVMDRFRQLGPEKKTGVRAGFVDYLSLTPEQRHADYRARLEKAIQTHPDDAKLRLDDLKLAIEDGDSARVTAAARAIAGMKTNPAIPHDAGRALLDARQTTLAVELLAQADAAAPSPAIALDLATATFRAGNTAKAITLLDAIPESAREGDYYLSRAEMLDASSKPDEARQALQHALDTAPARADFYQHAAAFLIAKGRMTDALQALDRGARALPHDREILLLRAVTAELTGQTDESERALTDLQNRWPEWPAAWTAHGMILDIHLHFDNARKALETAVALGAREPGIYFYLADSALQATPPDKDAAEKAIAQAIKLAPEDPWIHALAGRIERRTSGAAGNPPYLLRLIDRNAAAR